MGMVTFDLKLKVIYPNSSPKLYKEKWRTQNEYTTLEIFISVDGDLVGHSQLILPLKQLLIFAERHLHDKVDIHGQRKEWISTDIMTDVIINILIPEIKKDDLYLIMTMHSNSFVGWT